MKKMQAGGFALSVLLPLAVHAGGLEVGILGDKQVGKAQALAAATSTNPNPGSYDAVSPTGYGFRVAYTFLDLKVAGLGAAVTYHPKAEGNLELAGSNLGKFGDEYTSVGLQADWKFLVNIHAGVDYRSEKLTSSPVPGMSGSTTLTRPWAKVGLGFSAPMPVVSPFIRLEVAAPLSTPASKGDNDEDFRKAMAPSLQVALYGGIRF